MSDILHDYTVDELEFFFLIYRQNFQLNIYQQKINRRQDSVAKGLYKYIDNLMNIP